MAKKAKAMGKNFGAKGKIGGAASKPAKVTRPKTSMVNKGKGNKIMPKGNGKLNTGAKPSGGSTVSKNGISILGKGIKAMTSAKGAHGGGTKFNQTTVNRKFTIINKKKK